MARREGLEPPTPRFEAWEGCSFRGWRLASYKLVGRRGNQPWGHHIQKDLT